MKPRHIVLLGDSIFDNERYVPDGNPVIGHLRGMIPAGWQATLLAVDGDTTVDIDEQIAAMPGSATHLVLSIGGNDAINYIPVFEDKVRSIGEALSALAVILDSFRSNYRHVLERLMSFGMPLAVCTIYDSVPGLGKIEATALALFNDVIVKEAFRHNLTVIDLRLICSEETDYSLISPIEPSHSGGFKVAKSILDLQEDDIKQRSTVLTSIE